MNIVGISAFFHESAACLLQDGRLIAAAEEERFSRIKHDPALPVASFRSCLEAGGIGITDIDCLAYYESPVDKLARQLWSGSRLLSELPWLDSHRVERESRRVLGYEGPVETCRHHESHAASAFYFSGFEDAAILTVDGVGEWATLSYGVGRGDDLTLFDEVRFPHSLGLLYSAITGYLGFRVNGGEYRVMGLAPYGEPRFLDRLRKVVHMAPDGQFTLELQYFDYLRGGRMYSQALCDLLGEPARAPAAEITTFHKDVARSAQVLLEEVLLEKVGWLRARVPSENLCMAGGVALNCVANGRILREGPFRRLFVQPAAGDAGGALGAAALAHRRLTGARPVRERLAHAYLGPAFTSCEVADLLAAMGQDALDFREREPALLDAVAERLAASKVLGWFHGGMEFGPRALGARSILADPRDPGMRDRLNALVKKREAFRPFAPSILAEHAAEHLELDHASPFMLETCQVRSALNLPAITHVDGSARPQTVDRRVAPRFAALIEAFYRRTGCPLLVNTSFNMRDEPIVCTPVDAIRCMIGSQIDALVLEDFVIDRSMLADGLMRLAATAGRAPRPEAVSAVLYTLL